MNRLADTLQKISGDLEELNASWAVVGGLAVSVRAEPRLTRDIDLAVSVADDHDAERLVRAMHDRGYRPLEVVEHETARRLATARLSREEPWGIVVDLLFASCGIELEIVAGAEIVEVFPAVRVPVARRPHLIAMKLLARDDRARPQDFDDLRSLLVAVSQDEIAEVRRLLALITERGFARRRDLAAALDDAFRDLQ